MDYKAMGKSIKKHRLLANMTQEVLAEKCDCSVSHIGQIERACESPSLDMIVRIANALSVTVDQLLCESYDKPEYVYLVDIGKKLSKYSTSKRIIICESINTFIETVDKILESK